ncbi:hypothetical protein ABW21_db0203465 [Orbilia brochopaga]|nr:hypothetical protein ABW21_db0203465 [Drechslerella brochopaga]
MMARSLQPLKPQYGAILSQHTSTFTNHQSACTARYIQLRHISAPSAADASSATSSIPSTAKKNLSAENLDDDSKPKKYTVAEADEALRAAMGNIDGGGPSSVEMEGGKFVGLRKGVKDNMFRVI